MGAGTGLQNEGGPSCAGQETHASCRHPVLSHPPSWFHLLSCPPHFLCNLGFPTWFLAHAACEVEERELSKRLEESGRATLSEEPRRVPPPSHLLNSCSPQQACHSPSAGTPEAQTLEHTHVRALPCELRGSYGIPREQQPEWKPQGETPHEGQPTSQPPLFLFCSYSVSCASDSARHTAGGEHAVQGPVRADSAVLASQP